MPSLELNIPGAAAAIVKFIQEQAAGTRSRGVVVGISGGLDSAVVTFLCARALSPERVAGLYLPERDSAPESRAHARAAAEQAGVKLAEINLEPALKNCELTAARFPGPCRARSSTAWPSGEWPAWGKPGLFC